MAIKKLGKIEYLNPDDLIPYINNARTHSEEQISQIAGSIKEFGFSNPILVDEENGILAGHGRLMAAKKLGRTEVPVVRLVGLTEAQKKAYILADNKIAENSSWDNDLVKIELEQLREADFNIDLIGFSSDELDLIENGWDSDFKDPGEYEHDEAVKKITVKVGALDEEQAKEVITNALDSAGIEYEF